MADIKELKKYADSNNIPIIQDASLEYINSFISKNDISTVLEIGSAIGYSAISMALANPKLKITTIERDQDRYLEAVRNIKEFNLEDRITLIFKDALDVIIDETFDLIFIDAAKGQNINFFEKFERNLNPKGYIFTDNMNFHGLVDKDPEDIESRNVRQLVRKINEYKEYLSLKNNYEVSFLNIGDGLAIASKIEKK